MSVSETDVPTSKPGIRVLSLDGGDFRGLSSLILLRVLMERVKVSMEEHASATMRPCDYFDLIVGTGTGGLSALFLGRMQMTVDEAISTYLLLGEKCFKSSPVPLLQRLRRKEILFDGDSVTRFISDIVQKFVGDRDAQLQDSSPGIIGTKPDLCRTAVLATSRADASAPPFVFRSYHTHIDPTSTYSIHQAARATIATAGAFPPISIGSPPITFVDAGVAGYNNPAEVALHEVIRIWPGAKITCLVSLGTGLQDIVSIGETSEDATQVARRSMEDFEKVHYRLLQRSHRERLEYYRFNVTTGLDGTDIKEWDKETSGVIAGITEGHARKPDIEESLNACASILTGNTTSDLTPQDYEARSLLLLNTIKNDTLAKEISSWLKAPDCSHSYLEACRKHQEGTGAWFIEGEPFSQWKKDRASFLSVYGKPGCGKTVLCSSIISQVDNICQENMSYACAYFLFDGRNGQREFQLLDGLIRSLIRQFVHQCDGVPSLLVELYENRQRRPSTDTLGDLLTHILRGFTHAYIIIDSLDECAERRELLKWVKKIAVSKISNLHMLVTSRPEEEIKGTIQSFESPSTSMNENLVNHDIHVYMDAIIKEGQLDRWSETVQAQTKSTLMEKAQGMFRWLAMQLEEVENCLDEVELEEQLERLPKDLDETYHRILAKIPEQRRSRVRVVLQWTAFSARPPTLEELVEAGAMEFDQENVPKYNPRRKIRPRDVLTACGSLVIESNGRVQLSHFSVKEYLVSDRIRNGAAKYFGVSEKLSHSVIAKINLAYLLQLDSPGPLEHETLAAAPLATYAARNWVFHVRSGEGDGERATTKLIVGLLESENPLVNWIRLWDPENLQYGMQPRILSTEVAEPLYYASLLGLTTASQHLLDNGASVSPQRTGGDRSLEKSSYMRYGNALQAACHEGQVGMVQFLLENDVDVNMSGGKYGCGLQAAAWICDKVMVELLLDRGADVNMQGGEYGYALQAAACSGDVTMVSLLLERGADVHMRGGRYDTALQAAVCTGSGEAGELLMEKGTTRTSILGPLSFLERVTAGDQETLKSLLEKGMDANMDLGFVGSPLHLTSIQGYTEFVCLLLANHADVNRQAGIFGSPLQAACCGGSMAAVKLLLENNADVNAQGGLFGNALMMSVLRGHDDIVKLLLENHADANARTKVQTGSVGNTPGAMSLQRFFHERQVDLGAEEAFAYALHVASSYGRTNIVKMLLDHGADVNAQGGYFGNGLRPALAKGYDDIAKLLLENGYGATPPPENQHKNN